MSTASPSRLKTLWKGKGKATEQDFDDLNPVLTYRHILSNNLGVKDPLRVIALCDSDAFYAACEMVRLGVDKDTPLVVLQWEALIAVNYAARKFGISRMDKLKDAKKRCPHLTVVHVATYKEGEKEPGYWDNVNTNTHKVSLDYYRRESMKIAAMFKEGLPGCEVEKASIDEAFIDFTRPMREILLQRYPYLAQIPPDSPLGAETSLPPAPPISWDNLGELIPVNPHSDEDTAASDKDKDTKIEHARDEDQCTWHDIALSIAAELMGKVREHVRVTLGYSTSAGLARNKFLAKLTASHKKPNGQSILRNAAIPNYLKPLPFQKIRFLGGKLGEAIAKEYDASTVSELLTISLDEMQHKFGEESVWVYEVLRGIDRAEVKDKGSVLNKSMLASKNLPRPITKSSEGNHWIRVLAAELALRLSDARQLSQHLWPKTIVLHARRGYETGRSKQCSFPFARDFSVDTIAAAGNKLWKELVGNSDALNVTCVQLAFTGIDVAETGQRTIEGFLVSPTKKRQREVEDSYSLPSAGGLVPHGALDEPRGDNTDESILTHDQSVMPIPSFICVRCNKTIRLPQVHLSDTGKTPEDALAVLRMEHEDFHFAQDLAKGSPGTLPIKSFKNQSIKTTSKRKEPQGIAKFFNPK